MSIFPKHSEHILKVKRKKTTPAQRHEKLEKMEVGLSTVSVILGSITAAIALCSLNKKPKNAEKKKNSLKF